MTDDGTFVTMLGCASAFLNASRRWTEYGDDLIDCHKGLFFVNAEVDKGGRCGGDVGYNGGMHRIDGVDALRGNTFVGRVISGVTVKDVGDMTLEFVRSVWL